MVIASCAFSARKLYFSIKTLVLFHLPGVLGDVSAVFDELVSSRALGRPQLHRQDGARLAQCVRQQGHPRKEAWETLHPSRDLYLSRDIGRGIWVCIKRDSFATATPRGVAAPCAGPLTRAGIQSLSGMRRGLGPGFPVQASA